MRAFRDWGWALDVKSGASQERGLGSTPFF